MISCLPFQVLYMRNLNQLFLFFLQSVEWGTVALAEAERRLLANALLDFSNERFVLLSESCIPIYNFPIVYKYLINSDYSFVESYDDPSRYGRGRYSRNMLPDIKLYQWRKGSQWFELSRELAVNIVADTKYYTLFKKYCKPSCYPDEHYIQTFLNMFYGSLNANRSITWVDWSMGGPHPATLGAANITEGFIQALRNNGTVCPYNSEKTSVCYLFARKFAPSALEPLLNLTSKVMGFKNFWFGRGDIYFSFHFSQIHRILTQLLSYSPSSLVLVNDFCSPRIVQVVFIETCNWNQQILWEMSIWEFHSKLFGVIILDFFSSSLLFLSNIYVDATRSFRGDLGSGQTASIIHNGSSWWFLKEEGDGWWGKERYIKSECLIMPP